MIAEEKRADGKRLLDFFKKPCSEKVKRMQTAGGVTFTCLHTYFRPLLTSEENRGCNVRIAGLEEQRKKYVFLD